jgi:hypothetical protein
LGLLHRIPDLLAGENRMELDLFFSSNTTQEHQLKKLKLETEKRQLETGLFVGGHISQLRVAKLAKKMADLSESVPFCMARGLFKLAVLFLQMVLIPRSWNPENTRGKR